MKLLVFAVVLLQLASEISAQCVSPWVERSGQCMICSTTLSVAGTVPYGVAQETCATNGGNLATVLNANHQAFALTCPAPTWIGYDRSPFANFIDGTPFTSFGQTFNPEPPVDECMQILANGDWADISCTNTVATFICSKPFAYCRNLEVDSPEMVGYTHTHVTAPPSEKQWVGTVATYTCAPGFTLVGTADRTCQADGRWTDTEPHCVHMGLCPALVQADHSTLTYSGAAAGNSLYTVGMFATQKCVADYELEEGSYFRVCLPDGTWNGGMIVCEKEKNNALALGLGLGLGFLALVGIILLLWCCLCRPGGMGAPLPPGRPGYPLPRPEYPRPVRGYPRRVY